MPLPHARKGADVLGPGPDISSGRYSPAPKSAACSRRAERGPGGCEELDPAVFLRLDEPPGEGRQVGGLGDLRLHGGEELAALREVDGPAVVGIDEAEVPQFGALVEVGHPGRGQLEEGLGQRGVHAPARDLALEGQEVGSGRPARLADRGVAATKRATARS